MSSTEPIQIPQGPVQADRLDEWLREVKKVDARRRSAEALEKEIAQIQRQIQTAQNRLAGLQSRRASERESLRVEVEGLAALVQTAQT